MKNKKTDMVDSKDLDVEQRIKFLMSLPTIFLFISVSSIMLWQLLKT